MEIPTSPSPPERSAPPLRGPLLTGIMAALMLTLFLEALDGLIVSTALPHITSTLHGLDRYTWVITAYLLASTAVVPISGKLSDQFGRKGFLLAGTALFLLGSLLCGIARNMDQLIAFRALQGLGSGVGIALVFTIVGELFSPEERAGKQGMLGVVFGISNLLGPTLGGWITDHGPLFFNLVTETTRWRWIFYLNLPVGLLALLTLIFLLPASRAEGTPQRIGWAVLRRIDLPGALLFIAATCSLLLGLTLGSGGSSAWMSWEVPGLLVASVVLFILFFVVEGRTADPILPLWLFRKQVFAADALLTLVHGMALIGLGLSTMLFLQGVLAFSPTAAGALSTALSASLPIGAALTTLIVTRRKRYQATVIGGIALMAIASLLITRLTPQSQPVLIGLWLALFGLGCGAFFAVQMVAAQNVLPQAQLGVGTGVIRYLGQLGPTLGAAVVGIAVNGALAGDAFASLPTTPAARLALAGALEQGFLVILVLSVIALGITFWLKDVPMQQEAREMTV